MNKNPKFMLVGHAGSYNRGCEAIIRATLSMIRQEIPNPSFVISSFDYQNESRVDYGPNVRIIPALSYNQWKRFKRDWFWRQLNRLRQRDVSGELLYQPIKKELKGAEVVISVGGDNYSNDYGPPDYYIQLNNLISSLGKKLIIWGASIGPFHDDSNLPLIIQSLERADLITTRETLSIEYLSDLGITSNVKLVADPAFLLEPESVNFADICKANSRDVLGFNISPIMKNYRADASMDIIVNSCVDFLRDKIRSGMHILLIPHVNKPDSFNNDFDFMKIIVDRLDEDSCCSIVPANLNAMQLKYIISKCRFFIGARTHATIGALSSGVPTISIGYSLKSRGINRDLFGHTDYVLDLSLIHI